MYFDDLYEGLVVRVIDWGDDENPGHWNEDGEMDYLKGCLVTIGEIDEHEEYVYLTKEDDSYGWQFYADDFELPNQLNKDDPNMLFSRHIFSKRLRKMKEQIKKRKTSGPKA